MSRTRRVMCSSEPIMLEDKKWLHVFCFQPISIYNLREPNLRTQTVHKHTPTHSLSQLLSVHKRALQLSLPSQTDTHSHQWGCQLCLLLIIPSSASCSSSSHGDYERESERERETVSFLPSLAFTVCFNPCAVTLLIRAIHVCDLRVLHI